MKQLKWIQVLAYSIVAYVIIFIIWWASLLIRTEQKQFDAQKAIIELKEKYDGKSIVELEMALQKSTKMIVFEAFFFLLIFTIASWYVIKLLKEQRSVSDLKRNFLLATTHEFKTPLASLKLNLQTFQNNANLPEVAKQMLVNNSVNDVNRLNNLIDNILLSSKIDAHDYQFARLPVNLSQIVTTVAKQTNSDRVELVIEENCQILADETSMKIVVMNLVDNALKYSTDKIKVLLKKHHQTIELQIADTGVGIDLKNRKKVFQRFYRIEDERTRSTQGTGLGLYLVHSMVTANNGTIEIEDNTPNGTIFVIKLPEHA